MSQLDNLKAFDPFADASKGDEESGQEGVVHIRIQQRNGRKTLTTVQVGGSALCPLLCPLFHRVLLYDLFHRASLPSTTSRRS